MQPRTRYLRMVPSPQ
uniref:Uncharacterized protein n=1 Tax=Anguilla anguilla TaxID=7936 RepID=A0A0E9V8I6_ANGAN